MKKIFACFLLILFSLPGFTQLNAEQAAIKKTFFDFLSYYKKNEVAFNTFKLYRGTGAENSPPYCIQWKEAEKYFAFLRKQVPYVGEAYIKAEKQHFKNADSLFRLYPEDEIPAGFDYDRWGGGQESVQYMYKWYTSPKNKYLVIIAGNTAVLKIGSGLWEGASENDRSWNIVPFVKEKGKWKMADNIYPANEE